MASGTKTGGRQKGVPNKVTADVRKAVALIVERNIEAAQTWLEQIDDPAKRLGLLLSLMEYTTPKLARVEHAGEIEQRGPEIIKLTFVRAPEYGA